MGPTWRDRDSKDGTIAVVSPLIAPKTLNSLQFTHYSPSNPWRLKREQLRCPNMARGILVAGLAKGVEDYLGTTSGSVPIVDERSSAQNTWNAMFELVSNPKSSIDPHESSSLYRGDSHRVWIGRIASGAKRALQTPV